MSGRSPRDPARKVVMFRSPFRPADHQPRPVDQQSREDTDMRIRRALGILAVVLGLLGLSRSAAGQEPSYFGPIGYTDLKNRLGSATPTGAGILVSQIEGLSGGPNGFLPDASAFSGKTIIDKTGGGTVSDHATSVGLVYYGSSSIAPGITQIHSYRADVPGNPGDWTGSAYLRNGTTLAPLVDVARVQNHSYIGNAAANDPEAIEMLRRFDFAIARDNTIAIVAVNNGGGSVPALQASGYNSIAVGLTVSNSSSIGPTVFDGAGRSKPDIVVPFSATSFGTPAVSAAAVLLVQTAEGKTNPAEAATAGRVETIKATILSGATTATFSQISEPWHRTNNGTFVEPLDRRFGAGQLNINNSHLIISATQQNGTDSTRDSPTGWDFGTLTAAGQTRRYFFDVPDNAAAPTLTATATWLRRIPQSGGDFTTETATLANFQLRIFETDQNLNLGTLVDSSLSPIDNVQHTRTDLISTRHYAVEVMLVSLPAGQSSEDFAVAWQVTFTPVPEPGEVLLIATAALGIAVCVRRVRTGNGKGEIASTA